MLMSKSKPSDRLNSKLAAGLSEQDILVLRGVNKFYEKQQVLKNLDLSIRSGEFLTLLGPSGCGKTTTLNIVAGLVTPDTGEMRLRGAIATHLTPQKRRLGMVFQSWALFPHMTVFENVAYGLRMASISKSLIGEMVSDALSLVRLTGHDQKYPSQLSGGMQQRVALARALVNRPDLLLLDEPLSNLDATLRKEMQIELRRIHETLKVTTLLVTHSQEEALVMSDRIAVMRAGEVERIDSPLEIYRNPHTPFVCEFLGDANVIEARVEQVEGAQSTLRVGEVRITAPNAKNWRPGATVKIGMRPESIRIHAHRPPNEQNVWSGVLTDQIFKGSSVTYCADCLQTNIQITELPRPGGQVLSRDAQVFFAVAPSDIISFAREGL